jgi:hypothetical protein
MTKPQSSLVDVATEMLTDLQGFNRSGGKEVFLKQVREEFVLRSGAANLDEARGKAMASLLCQTLQTSWPGRKLQDHSSRQNQTVSRNGSQQALDCDQGGNESGCGMFGSVR